MEKVGKDAVILRRGVEGPGIRDRVRRGVCSSRRGYISPYFVTNAETMEAVIEEPYILIHDKKISAVCRTWCRFWRSWCSRVPASWSSFFEDVDGEALATLVVNKLRGCSTCWPSRLPASVIAARRCSRISPCSPAGTSSPRRRAEAGKRHAGRSRARRQVVSTKDETTIVGGRGDEKMIKARIEQIKAEIERSTSDYDREKLQERLAKLAGGVAIIRVGAATETELKEKKHPVGGRTERNRAASRRDRPRWRGWPCQGPEGAPTRVKIGLRRQAERVFAFWARGLEIPVRRIGKTPGLDRAAIPPRWVPTGGKNGPLGLKVGPGESKGKCAQGGGYTTTGQGFPGALFPPRPPLVRANVFLTPGGSTQIFWGENPLCAIEGRGLPELFQKEGVALLEKEKFPGENSDV